MEGIPTRKTLQKGKKEERKKKKKGKEKRKGKRKGKKKSKERNVIPYGDIIGQAWCRQLRADPTSKDILTRSNNNAYK